jgi:hypothetical protein
VQRIMVVVHRFALVFVALAGCSVTEAQSTRVPPMLACRVNADCVIVVAPPSCGPCGTCRGAPQAMSRRYVDRETRACAAQRRREAARERMAERRGQPRRVPPNCEPCRAPPESASLPYEAVCEQRTCTARVSAP